MLLHSQLSMRHIAYSEWTCASPSELGLPERHLAMQALACMHLHDTRTNPLTHSHTHTHTPCTCSPCQGPQPAKCPGPPACPENVQGTLSCARACLRPGLLAPAGPRHARLLTASCSFLPPPSLMCACAHAHTFSSLPALSCTPSGCISLHTFPLWVLPAASTFCGARHIEYTPLKQRVHPT